MWIDKYDPMKYIQEKEGYIEACGGDGTLIRAIHMHKDKNKPFFGIASGTMNFLMNKDLLPIKEATHHKFFLIEVNVKYMEDNIIKEAKVNAFNDVIIGEFNGWIEFDCYDKDNILGEFNGAAILISTAQGSTGANKNNHGTILPLSSKNWSITGVQTNRKVNYVIENKELIIKSKARGNIKINVDGSYFEKSNVLEVSLRKGGTVKVIFNNIKEFKKKRQQN